jgi:hypothetical protein
VCSDFGNARGLAPTFTIFDTLGKMRYKIKL